MAIRSVKMVTTTIDESLWLWAKEYGISWKKALELGIRVLLYEKDPLYFDAPDLKVFKQVDKIRQKLENVYKEI